MQQFPSLKLPSLPRKYHLFLSQSDIDERQMCFDCLLTVLARNADICTSIPMLQFLGADLLGDRKYHKRRKDYLEKQEQMTEQEKAREEQIIGNLKDNEEDLFAEVVEASSGATNTAEQRFSEDSRQSATSDLFGSEETTGTADPQRERLLFPCAGLCQYHILLYFCLVNFRGKICGVKRFFTLTRSYDKLFYTSFYICKCACMKYIPVGWAAWAWSNTKQANDCSGIRLGLFQGVIIGTKERMEFSFVACAPSC